MKVTLLNHEQLELTEALDNMYNDEYYYKYFKPRQSVKLLYNEVAT